jgi:adenylate kinase family enzyme
VAAADGRLLRGQPQWMAVYAGHLFLCSSADALRAFIGAPAHYCRQLPALPTHVWLWGHDLSGTAAVAEAVAEAAPGGMKVLQMDGMIALLLAEASSTADSQLEAASDEPAHETQVAAIVQAAQAALVSGGVVPAALYAYCLRRYREQFPTSGCIVTGVPGAPELWQALCADASIAPDVVVVLDGTPLIDQLQMAAGMVIGDAAAVEPLAEPPASTKGGEFPAPPSVSSLESECADEDLPAMQQKRQRVELAMSWELFHNERDAVTHAMAESGARVVRVVCAEKTADTAARVWTAADPFGERAEPADNDSPLLAALDDATSSGDAASSVPWGDTLGACPVTLCTDRVHCPGSRDFAAVYQGRLYLCRDQAALDAFTAAPALYVNEAAPCELPPPRVCVIGAAGSGADELASSLAAAHKLALVRFQDLIEAHDKEQKQRYLQALCEFRLQQAARVNAAGEVEEPAHDNADADAGDGEPVLAEMAQPLDVVAALKPLWQVAPGSVLSGGFVLSGFPRSAEEMQLAVEAKLVPDAVVYVSVDEDVVMRREFRRRLELERAKDRELLTKLQQFELAQQLRRNVRECCGCAVQDAMYEAILESGAAATPDAARARATEAVRATFGAAAEALMLRLKNRHVHLAQQMHHVAGAGGFAADPGDGEDDGADWGNDAEDDEDSEDRRKLAAIAAEQADALRVAAAEKAEGEVLFEDLYGMSADAVRERNGIVAAVAPGEPPLSAEELAERAQQRESDLKERVIREIVESLERYTTAGDASAGVLSEAHVPMFQLDGSRPVRALAAKAVRFLRPVLANRLSYTERPRAVSCPVAVRLLAAGMATLSAFQRWCPVSHHAGDKNGQGLLPLELDDEAHCFPVVYRKRLYVCASEERRAQFCANPLRYVFEAVRAGGDAKQLAAVVPPPPQPVRLAVVGPPKSGRSGVVRRLCDMLGTVRLTVALCVRWALRSRSHCEWMRKLHAQLSRGEPLTLGSASVLRCVRERLWQPDVLTRGFVWDGVPLSVAEWERLFGSDGAGAIPARVIELQVGDMESMRRADWQRTALRTLTLQHEKAMKVPKAVRTEARLDRHAARAADRAAKQRAQWTKAAQARQVAHSSLLASALAAEITYGTVGVRPLPEHAGQAGGDGSLAELPRAPMRTVAEWERDARVEEWTVPEQHAEPVVLAGLVAWERDGPALRERCCVQFNNWSAVDATRCKWWVYETAVDVLRRNLWARRNYEDSTHRNHERAARAHDLCRTPASLSAELGTLGWYCPVRFVDHMELCDMSHVTDLETAAVFQGKYYIMEGPEELAAFLHQPSRYAGVRLPVKLPQRRTREQVRMAFPKQIELRGLCPVTYVDGARAYEALVYGSGDCVCEYDGKLYSLASSEAQERFMRQPWKYVDVVLPKRIPPRVEPVPLSGLPQLGYLEQVCASLLSEALVELGKLKPKYPFLGVRESALRFLGLYMKAHNSKSTVSV